MSETVRPTERNHSPRKQSILEESQSEARRTHSGAVADRDLLPNILQETSLEEDLAAGPILNANRERLLWRSRGFLLRITAAGLLLSASVVFLIPPRFESTARLMPPDQDSFSGGLASRAAASSVGAQIGAGISPIAGELLGLRSSTELFIAILQSRTVLDDVVQKFQLTSVYSDRRAEDARDDLALRTSISADRKSGVLTIRVVDRDARRAAAMAGEYSSELNRVVTELNTSSAHRERVFLEERLVQVKQDLESAERNFSEFATKNTALDVPTQSRALIEAAASLQGQLIAARTELQGLRQTYTDQNLRVRAQQARVNELDRQLTLTVSGPSEGAGQFNGPSPYPSIQELPALGVGYSDLFRNTKIQEAVYQTLTQEYELAKVQEAKETPSVKILDPPDVPSRKAFPPRLWIIVIGTLLSGGLGIAWICFTDAWRRIDAGHPQKILAEEVLQDVRAFVGARMAPSGLQKANGDASWLRRARARSKTNF